MMIEVNNLYKTFRSKQGLVKAINGVDIKVEKEEFLVIKGHSGSGKSSLLFMLGGLSKPSLGEVFINGENLYQLNQRKRNECIANKIGFVFQAYHLFAFFNILENILIVNKGLKKKITTMQAKEIAERLGLKDRLYHKPSQLSSGEKQRVALARALATKPEIILADEPTGNLDEKNSTIVLDYLKEYQKNGGTVVMVSHENLPDCHATKILQINKGRIV